MRRFLQSLVRRLYLVIGIQVAFLVALVMMTASLFRPQTSPQIPFLGTWKLNLAKSNYGTFPLPNFAMLVVEDRGGGFFKQVNTGQPAEGPGGTEEQTLKCDGEDHAYQSNIQVPNRPKLAETRYLSCVARDPLTFDFTVKDESKRVLNLYTRVMSADGLAFTQSERWLYRGEPVNRIVVNGRTLVAPVGVFEKQSTP